MIFPRLSFFKKITAALVLPALSFLQNSANGQCITKFPDRQSFETSNGNWTTGGSASDWSWGTPSKSIIKTAGFGSKCWITGGLNKSSYNDGELSWVKSPCYDLSSLKYPTVGFFVNWETEYNYDGTVLQYSTDGGNTWVNAGSTSDAKNCLNMNWFNTNSVKYLGNDNGWSGSSGNGGGCGSGNGSNGWVPASHTLPALAGKSNVRFRFLFGAGTSCNGYNGFAFDEFTVGDAPPNMAAFSYSCTNANTVTFTNGSILCPNLSWNFGDPSSGASNTSTTANPTHTFSNAGQYTITLTATGPDNAPSTITKVITILDLNTQITASPLCNGDKTGSATVTATPGIAGLNYSWNTSPAQLSATANNLGKGTYIVTVSGTDVCTAQDNVTITEPVLLSSTTITDQPTCSGNDGKITLGTTGGTVPYTYTWTPSNTNSNTISGLGSGNYSVTVKDANLCTETKNFTLTAPTSIIATISSQQDVICNGNKNGTATVTVSGGTGPYTYAWSPSGGSNATATALSGGVYTVTVKDPSGCTTTATATINEPAILTAAMSSTDAVCGKNNGTASATITGGVLPYSYAWAPGAYNTASITNLSPQDYYLTVTDKNGCKVSGTASVKATSTSLSVLASSTDVKCFGDKTGTAAVSVTGGQAPYSITWSNGATGASITNLGKGSYSATITDALGCIATTTVAINEPGVAALAVSLSGTNPVCHNGKGIITTTVSNGTPGYQYQWSPGGASTANLTNASAGAYQLLLTDKNGCTATANYTLTDPTDIVVTLDVQNTSCGGGNGVIKTSVTGGTSPYTYNWNPVTSTNSTISNLVSGTYNVSVQDKNGCSQTATAKVEASSSLTLQIQHTDIACFGDKTGTATANVTGGLQPYTITWSNGATGANITNLVKGNYSAVVTDASGCKVNSTISINEPATALKLTLNATDAICNKGTGSINSVVSGGTPVYNYTWSAAGISGATANNLQAGSYSLTVKDNNGCSATAATIINEPAAIAASFTIQNATCGVNNGGVTATVTGGLSPYTYTWMPGNIASAGIKNVSPGSYNLTVTDKNGCQLTKEAIVSTTSGLSITPTITNVKCHGEKSGGVTIAITGGATPYSIQWSNGMTTPAISNLPKGTYSVIVNDAAGCSVSTTIVVYEPEAISIALQGTNAVCNNKDGQVSSAITGGVAPYKYLWMPGNIASQHIQQAIAGDYTLVLTDNNGCSQTATASIAKTNPLKIYLGKDTSICDNDRIVLFPGNFASYQWQDNSTASGFTVTHSGIYGVTVTDQRGCVASDSIVISGNCGEIWFPSGFTPNSDGLNDKFGPLGNTASIGKYSLSVFNRWGEKVFESYDPGAKWDGRFKGQMLSGTYTWFARYESRGNTITQKGTLVLVR